MAVLLLLLLLLVSTISTTRATINIGGLFLNTEHLEEKIFQLTTEYISSTNPVFRNRLTAVSELVEPYNSLKVSQNVCKLLQLGIAGIFGPRAGPTSPQVQSICDTKDIPHIETSWDTKQRRQDLLVNLHPHPSTLTTLYVEMVTAWDWKTFTILYEDSSGLIRLNSLLKMYDKKGKGVTIRQLDPLHNHRPVLRRIRNSGEKNIILDCSTESLPEVLKQAQQVGLMTSVHNYIITSLDLHTVDLEPYKYGDTNITGLRMFDPQSDIVQNTVKHWEALELKKGKKFDITPQDVTMNMALIHDAVQLLAKAIQRLDPTPVKELDCESQESWGHGTSLINFMKDGQSTLRGMSGLIKFDNEGFRTNIMVDIMELTHNGLKRVGSWNTTDGLNITRAETPMYYQDNENFMNRTFRVITSLAEPYTMRRRSSTPLKGNDRFEGFAIDLIHELSLILGFNYTFTLQEDKMYDGMLDKIRNNTADLAIVDLTITSHRESVVDFTMPFMTLGISILYKRPTKAAPSLFSFMSPFSLRVWLCMFSVYIGVSLLLWIMGRICPYEWKNPYPCIQEPDELENQFTLRNSLWFTIGSLMQQGSEIAPIAVSTRMVAGIWWFFTLIIVSSYTANLAAFLTVESMTTPFKNVKELANQKVIKYGAKKNGSTVTFFRDSGDPMYQKMYQYMMDNADEVLTTYNEEALEWVKTNNYAYFMESTSIEYFTERHCEVAQIGEPLDSKGYGIAMRKNSTYRNQLSTAVLKLQESGQLTKLKTKWWKEERGGGKCLVVRSSGNPSALNLQNVGGVFVVLVVGLGLACVVAVFELLCSVCETSRRNKVPFRDELIEELKFITRCHGSTKPIRKYNHHNRDNIHHHDSRDFIHMSIYGSSPYGINNTIMKDSLS